MPRLTIFESCSSRVSEAYHSHQRPSGYRTREESGRKWAIESSDDVRYVARKKQGFFRRLCKGTTRRPVLSQIKSRIFVSQRQCFCTSETETGHAYLSDNRLVGRRSYDVAWVANYISCARRKSPPSSNVEFQRPRATGDGAAGTWIVFHLRILVV